MTATGAAGMNRRFAECIAVVLRHEGGFVNHPRDPGGATNRGITLRTLREWRQDDSLTAEDVRALSESDAREIYLARFWNPIRGDELPPGLDLALLDFAVNSGQGRAVRVLQEVLGVATDGAIGRRTLDAVRAADAADLVRDLCRRRLAFLQRLPTWDAFGRGWRRRVEEVEREALARAARPALTLGEARQTDTVQVATRVASAAAPAAAAVPAMVGAFEGLHPAVAVALIVAGLVLVIVGAWLAAAWLRARRA
jgi:lysozyme family protein